MAKLRYWHRSKSSSGESFLIIDDEKKVAVTGNTAGCKNTMHQPAGYDIELRTAKELAELKRVFGMRGFDIRHNEHYSYEELTELARCKI